MAGTLTSEQIEKLSVEERMKLLEMICQSLASAGAEVPTPDWQRELVRKRVEEYRRDPGQGTDAFEFLDNLNAD